MKLKIRSMICAPKGKTFVACDLSQAETWVVAYKSNCIGMKDALLNSDIHRKTGSAIYEKPFEDVTTDERYTGKRINHASSYRMSPERFTQVYNKDSPVPISNKQSKEYNIKWHQLYPEIKDWWKDIEAQLSNNRSLTTPYGRKRVFFQGWGQELFKEATAFVPQSTVADHFNGLVHPDVGIVGGLLEIKRQIVDKYKDILIVNQAHDSAMLEVPISSAYEIAAAMHRLLRRPIIINSEECTIPVDCEIGERWGELEKYRIAT